MVSTPVLYPTHHSQYSEQQVLYRKFPTAEPAGQPSNTFHPSRTSSVYSSLSPVSHTQSTPSLTVLAAASSPLTFCCNFSHISSLAVPSCNYSGARSKKAPSFVGCAGELLDLFYPIRRPCQLVWSYQCHAVLRYIDSATKELWTSLPEYDAATEWRSRLELSTSAP